MCVCMYLRMMCIEGGFRFGQSQPWPYYERTLAREAQVLDVGHVQEARGDEQGAEEGGLEDDLHQERGRRGLHEVVYAPALGGLGH